MSYCEPTLTTLDHPCEDTWMGHLRGEGEKPKAHLRANSSRVTVGVAPTLAFFPDSRPHPLPKVFGTQREWVPGASEGRHSSRGQAPLYWSLYVLLLLVYERYFITTASSAYVLWSPPFFLSRPLRNQQIHKRSRSVEPTSILGHLALQEGQK